MNICVPYFFLLPFPTPNKSVHSTAWTLWSLGRHRLPAPQWVRLHYCHSRAGAAPAIDVATTLYKAAQSPGGRHRLRDARMGRMADPFGVAEPVPLLFPCKSIDWTAVFSIASSGTGSSQPIPGTDPFQCQEPGAPHCSCCSMWLDNCVLFCLHPHYCGPLCVFVDSSLCVMYQHQIETGP